VNFLERILKKTHLTLKCISGLVLFFKRNYLFDILLVPLDSSLRQLTTLEAN